MVNCVFSSLETAISGRVAGGNPFAAVETGNAQAETTRSLEKTGWRLADIGIPLEATRSDQPAAMRVWRKRDFFSENSK
jgi:hypothetical protein